MDYEKIPFTTKFISSMTDPRGYRKFLRLPSGSAFLYLLLLTLIIGTIGLIRPIYEFNSGISEMAGGFSEKVRDFTFSNGELDVNGDMPIVFESENDIFIVDTSGKTEKSVLDKYSNGVLITKHSIIQKQNLVETREINLKDIQGFTVTKADVEKLIPFLRVFNIFILVFGLIGFYLGKMFTALIVAVFALVISNILKVKLSYGSLYKLSLYAMTLPILISTTLGILDLKFPHFYKLYCLIAVIYMYLAVKTIGEEQEMSLQ